MLEFLFNKNLIITHCIEAFAVIMGVFYLKKHNGTAAIFFIRIMVYLFLVDILGMYIYYIDSFSFLKALKGTKLEDNYWWYTIFFDIIVVLLFAIFYFKILEKRKHRCILKYASMFFLIISIIVILYDFNHLFKNTYSIIGVIGAILIIKCSILYFIEVLQSDKILTFSRSLYFYISITIFLWWLVVTPVVFYDKYFITEDLSFKQLKRSIYIFANIFMYSTFSIGLIVSKPEKTV